MLNVDFIVGICYNILIKLTKSLTTKLPGNYTKGYSENWIKKLTILKKNKLHQKNKVSYMEREVKIIDTREKKTRLY